MQERDLMGLQMMTAQCEWAVGVCVVKCRYCTGTCGALEAPGVTSAWGSSHVPVTVHCINLPQYKLDRRTPLKASQAANGMQSFPGAKHRASHLDLLDAGALRGLQDKDALDEVLT